MGENVHGTKGQALYSRRAVLRLAAGMAGTGLLAACGSAGSSGNETPTAGAGTSQGAGGATPAPTVSGAASPVAGSASPAGTVVGQPSMSVSASGTAGSSAAEFPGNLKVGLPAGYTRLPSKLVKTVDKAPGKGGSVRAFTIAYQSPPIKFDDNKYWQELNKRLNVKWNPIITPQPDYGDKSSVLIASGDIPDLFYLNPGQNALPQYQAMQQGAFVDLSQHVTGDALKAYPNLAGLPPYVWNNVQLSGKIYGVPKPTPRNGNIGFYRGDWLKHLGSSAPGNADEAYEMLVDFSKKDPDGDGKDDTYGMGQYGGWDNSLIMPMFNVPDGWRVDKDGTFTNQLLTDEYEQGLAFMHKLWKGGGYNPDSASMTFTQAQQAFLGGKDGFHSEGFGSFFGANGLESRARKNNKKAYLRGLIPPGANGGKAITYNFLGYFGFTGIPSKTAKNEERLKELMGILNYLAAPFGSEERLFLDFGIEGWDFKYKSPGVPVSTDKGSAERGDIVYLMGGPPVIFYPDVPEDVKRSYDLSKQILAIGIDDPTMTLYSPTDSSKGSTLNQIGRDYQTAIVTGRKPLSALDDWRKEWKSRGGDQITQEYEEAYQKSKQ